MDYIYLSKFGSISGTISILLTYVYLYALYRERYMGMWAIAWFIFFYDLSFSILECSIGSNPYGDLSSFNSCL